ncbi:hypothetical protein OQA88_7574 [Cercophora sp. LCS_1]
MRLIGVQTLELKECIAEETPPYAILSHTWGDGEVSFQDFQDHAKAREKPGFRKIKFCCEEAYRDGLDWAWVDTRCINKTSSAELSETINSMFRYYQNAILCYAYISDQFQEPPSEQQGREDLLKSRWFTRGWTLQELIAPSRVVFFDRSWTFIATKRGMAQEISEATGISVDILNHETVVSRGSAYDRMRWASKRHTTRVEGIAYCLMGIFNVNMALLYGEGKNAFIRLQGGTLTFIDPNGIAKDHPSTFQSSSICGALAGSLANFLGMTYAGSGRFPSMKHYFSPGARGQPQITGRFLQGALSISRLSNANMWRVSGFLRSLFDATPNATLRDKLHMDFLSRPYSEDAFQTVSLGGEPTETTLYFARLKDACSIQGSSSKFSPCILFCKATNRRSETLLLTRFRHIISCFPDDDTNIQWAPTACFLDLHYPCWDWACSPQADDDSFKLCLPENDNSPLSVSRLHQSTKAEVEGAVITTIRFKLGADGLTIVLLAGYSQSFSSFGLEIHTPRVENSAMLDDPRRFFSDEALAIHPRVSRTVKRAILSVGDVRVIATLVTEVMDAYGIVRRNNIHLAFREQ